MVGPVLSDGYDVAASLPTRCRDTRNFRPCRCGDLGFVSRHKPAERRFLMSPQLLTKRRRASRAVAAAASCSLSPPRRCGDASARCCGTGILWSTYPFWYLFPVSPVLVHSQREEVLLSCHSTVRTACMRVCFSAPLDVPFVAALFQKLAPDSGHFESASDRVRHVQAKSHTGPSKRRPSLLQRATLSFTCGSRLGPRATQQKKSETTLDGFAGKLAFLSWLLGASLPCCRGSLAVRCFVLLFVPLLWGFCCFVPGLCRPPSRPRLSGEL